jgi:hypothetical protein
MGARTGFRRARWSPDGKWISVSTPTQDWHGDTVRVVFIGLDGVVRHELVAADRLDYDRPTKGWDYAPSGGVIYALGKNGAVTRHDLASGRSEEVWSINAAGLDPEDWGVREASLAVSPDGERVAVALAAFESPEHRTQALPRTPPNQTRSLIAVFPPDGRGTQVLFDSQQPIKAWHALAWSGDSSTLFSVAAVGKDRLDSQTEAYTWRVGQGKASVATLPRVLGPPTDTAVLPGNRLLVDRQVWASIVDSDGHVSPLKEATSEALEGASIAGVDKQGRLIVEKFEVEERLVQGVPDALLPSYIAAVDVDSGQLTKVYP